MDYFDRMIENGKTPPSHFTVNQQNFINNQGNDQQLNQILKDLENSNRNNYTNQSNINSIQQYNKTLNDRICALEKEKQRIDLLEKKVENFTNGRTTPSFQQFEISSSSPAFATRRAVKRQNDLENSLFYSSLESYFQLGATFVSYTSIKKSVLEAQKQKWYTDSKPIGFFDCPSIDELQYPYLKTQKQAGGQYCYITKKTQE